MDNIAIRVNNLSKRYRIGLKDEVHDTIIGSFASWLKSPLKNYKRLRSLSKFDQNSEADDIIWALRDVSFEVKEGEAIGVIGRNGAGKSTLLKVLSRITEPSKGRVEIRGRVSSLLEVGTGFHPELTGRENIYLNGTILGMSKKEIDSKFDEIVDFSGVEKFIDTPIKRYSSGMNVRLAFAVAAHLEPEILIIDEVLAVGDAEFQRKCLGKMENVAKGGRTVVFCSHNLHAIRDLCNRSILIDDGRLLDIGDSQAVVNNYLTSYIKMNSEQEFGKRGDKYRTDIVQVEKFKIKDSNYNEVECMHSGNDFFFEIEYNNKENNVINDVVVSLDIYDDENNRVLLFRSNFTDDNFTVHPGRGSIICRVNNLPLVEGLYYFSVFLSHNDKLILDYVNLIGPFKVLYGDYFGTGAKGLPEKCKILRKVEWQIEHKIENKVNVI